LESHSRTQGLPGWLSVESSLFFGLTLYQAELFSQETKVVTGFGFSFTDDENGVGG
jgi:hypothetical protein